VLLRGLNVDGAGTGAGFGPIVFNTGSKLLIHDCIVQNWLGVAGNGAIQFTPRGASFLVVTNSIISHNTDGTNGAGILVRPSGSGSARVSIERTIVEGNGFGIAADGTGSTAGINMTITDSVLAANTQDGVVVKTPSGGAPIGIMVTNTRSTNNGFGIRSIGPNVAVRVENFQSHR
jgi:hypothetical protein